MLAFNIQSASGKKKKMKIAVTRLANDNYLSVNLFLLPPVKLLFMNERSPPPHTLRLMHSMRGTARLVPQC